MLRQNYASEQLSKNNDNGAGVFASSEQTCSFLQCQSVNLGLKLQHQVTVEHPKSILPETPLQSIGPSAHQRKVWLKQKGPHMRSKGSLLMPKNSACRKRIKLDGVEKILPKREIAHLRSNILEKGSNKNAKILLDEN